MAWLLSAEADQVNGEILRLDGGYTVTAAPDPTRGGRERWTRSLPASTGSSPTWASASWRSTCWSARTRSVLIDTGLANTPDEVLIPALERPASSPT